jgi:hypothetical protein
MLIDNVRVSVVEVAVPEGTMNSASIAAVLGGVGMLYRRWRKLAT